MDDKFLRDAIQQSQESVKQGAFPVGVVIIIDGRPLVAVIGNGKQLNDPTSHAEIAAIRTACSQLETRDLSQATLYSSMEPCLMCYAACVWASIHRIVYDCSKDRLSSMHFEGTHDLVSINQAARRPINLVHLSSLEDEALEIVTSWEKSLTQPS